MIEVQFTGADTLSLRLQKIETSLRSEESQRVFMAIARAARDAAKSRAPVGPTGHLKKSIVAVGVSRTWVYRLGPAAFTRVNLFKGTVRAPHAHLVEFGTKERTPKNKKVMRFQSNGRWVTAKRVKPMPATRFFRKSVDAVLPFAVNLALAAVDRLIAQKARG